jgi:hypothetical protein
MNKLNEITKKNPFKVPDNYFEEANRKIISDSSYHTLDVKRESIFSRFKPYLFAAASVAAFLIISYAGIKLLLPDRETNQLSEVIAKENPEMYLNDIDIFTLEENAESMALINDQSDVTKKDIIDYLLLDDIEINEIYAQL